MDDMGTERKVIQMMPLVVPGMDNMSTPHVGFVALCDDGTIWESASNSGGSWYQIPGPEHQIANLRTGYYVREELQKLLTKDKYEKVTHLLRSGGASL